MLVHGLARAARAGIAWLIALACLFDLGLARTTHAGNIDLTTVPQRESVQLTIYNGADMTLVREVRTLTFRKGLNPLQFSWEGTLIDPTSVDLQFRSHDNELEIVDTTFPLLRAEVLQWTIRSAYEGDALVEISYFTSGISWKADYTCVATTDESTMGLRGFVRITNHSGENYENAQVRLVVGQISLVDEIAELAREGILGHLAADLEEKGLLQSAWHMRFDNAPDFDLDKALGMVKKTMRRTFKGGGGGGYGGGMDGSGMGGGGGGGLFDAAEEPPEIIKEGLSEYFIYTVEGTQSIPTGWSRRLRLFEAEEVPFEIHHRIRPEEYGPGLTRLYIVRNDEEHKLGSTPLPDGTIMVMKQNEHDGLSFVAAFTTKYVPIGQEIAINVGADALVRHTRLDLRRWRDKFWFRGGHPHQVFSPDAGHRVRPEYSLVGWNEHRAAVERIVNSGPRAIEVEIRVRLDGHVVVRSRASAKNHDYRTVEFKTTVAPGAQFDLPYEVEQFLGINAKQDRVTIE